MSTIRPANFAAPGDLPELHNRAFVAKSGKRAPPLADATPMPDLIRLDTKMPGTVGYETLAALRRPLATRGIRVISVTARDADLHEAHGLQPGATDEITGRTPLPSCPAPS